MKVTALAGGVGGAKLLVGLDRVVPAEDLTAVVNVADDDEIYGVMVSPDVDIVTYWLAGLADTERGWGIQGDTFRVVDALARLGIDAWFRLGDRDFATCLYRTQRMRDGATLTAVTHDIKRALSVGPEILPASDDPVRTRVATGDGRTLGFQEYFVKEQTRPTVTEVRYAGVEEAKPGPAVRDAVDNADLVIVCPSNPVLSVAPIVELPGLRSALVDHPRVVAVSPIVGGAAVKGPADRLLQNLTGEATASSVARLYREFCDVFVLDEVDSGEIAAVGALGMEAVALDTMMPDHQASARLARAILALAQPGR